MKEGTFNVWMCGHVVPSFSCDVTFQVWDMTHQKLDEISGKWKPTGPHRFCLNCKDVKWFREIRPADLERAVATNTNIPGDCCIMEYWDSFTKSDSTKFIVGKLKDVVREWRTFEKEYETKRKLFEEVASKYAKEFKNNVPDELKDVVR